MKSSTLAYNVLLIEVVEWEKYHKSYMNMKEIISFYDALKSKNKFLSTILLILFNLEGCKSIDVKDKPDLLPYMMKPVSLLSAKSPRNLESVWPELMDKMEQKLKKMPVLGRITGIKELNNKLDVNPKLRSAYKTYISTLTLTGISDKEIALKLEDEFESPHFLLLDFLSFPCTKECPSDEQWVIRLKLIEVKTGDIIYRARLAHKIDEDEQDPNSYHVLAQKLISNVMAEFQSGFIVPWHRWRYEHMKKVSDIKPRSEMGI